MYPMGNKSLVNKLVTDFVNYCIKKLRTMTSTTPTTTVVISNAGKAWTFHTIR